MKRILTCMLLLANLFSGMAFAVDNGPAAVLGHEVTGINHVLEADSLHSEESLFNGDHCSHGAAHLVGIFYNSPLKEGAVDNLHQSASVASLAFLYISPLLRPPIV